MEKVLIVPIGKVTPGLLQTISSEIGNTFHIKTAVVREISIPRSSFNSSREQYSASKILAGMKSYRREDAEILLGVIDVDLFAADLNYVFGEAEPYEGAAVISLSRLKQEFYGLPGDRDLLKERAIKEAIHELGHVCGLDHCPRPECVMYFSNRIADTDMKGKGFCNICKDTQRHTWNIDRNR